METVAHIIGKEVTQMKVLMVLLAFGDFCWIFGVFLYTIPILSYGNHPLSIFSSKPSKVRGQPEHFLLSLTPIGNIGYSNYSFCIIMGTWVHFWASSVKIVTLLISVYIYFSLFHAELLAENDKLELWYPVAAIVYFLSLMNTYELG
jgi:hypothetical protein